MEIELIKPPTEKSERKKQYRIYASGLPDSLEMDVEALVDCPCENPENSVCSAKYFFSYQVYF